MLVATRHHSEKSSNTTTSHRRRRPARLTPEQIARLDQLLAERISVIECPEFFDEDQHAAILADWPHGDNSERPQAPAGTPPYLASLYETPLLGREEETHLFRQMHFYRFLARDVQNRLRKSPRAADLDRLESLLANANRVRNAIVQANLRLVVSIAKTMVDASNSLDELISEGNVPLMRAVEIFDYTRGLRFSTYATWAIRHSLFRLTPRNRLRRKRFLTGVEPSSLPVPVIEPEQKTDPVATKKSISALLTDLDDRERVIVERRFGLGKSSRAFKFREIAGELSISTERVRQLLARALDRLRGAAGQMGLDWDSVTN